MPSRFTPYRQKVCAFPRTICFVASDMFRIGRAPGTRVISSYRMLNLDDFCTKRGTAYVSCKLIRLRIIGMVGDNHTGNLPTLDLLKFGYNMAKNISARCP